MVLNCNSSTLTFCKKRHTLHSWKHTHIASTERPKAERFRVPRTKFIWIRGVSARTDSWLAPWTSLCVADWVQDGAPVQGRHRGTVSCVPQCTTIRLVDGMLQVQP